VAGRGEERIGEGGRHPKRRDARRRRSRGGSDGGAILLEALTALALVTLVGASALVLAATVNRSIGAERTRLETRIEEANVRFREEERLD